MNNENFKEYFKRYEGNPILTLENWPYKVGAVFNPGAIKFNDEILLLVRAEDKQGYSHLTIAKSKDGKKKLADKFWASIDRRARIWRSHIWIGRSQNCLARGPARIYNYLCFFL